MKKNNIVLKKNIALLIILFIAFVALQIILQTANRSENLSIYKGVFTSLQYGVCLLMMLVNLKHGTRIAIVLMGLSVMSLFIIVMKGMLSAVPGLFNSVFYIITIIVIARYDTNREIESRSDAITGVYNRKGLYIELQNKINKGLAFSVIYITLNNFKAINDTYGHAFGDELLRKIAKRIEIKFGKDCVIARVGGAEFAVTIDSSLDAQLIADQLLDAIREKTILVVDDNSVDCYIEGFAGVASFPKDANDYESVIKYADIAMSEALSNKSKHAIHFDLEMLNRINRQTRLKNLIKDGLQRHKFYLVYQPQFDIKEKKLRGFETLLRMRPIDGEYIGPGEFIPVAEKSDLIFQIDDYVLNRAMREFREIVLNNPELVISINVSAKNFGDLGFVNKVKKILGDMDFPAKNLEIEITEYCMVNSLDVTKDNIIALRELGIKVALDDFGTGYTSLNYVASLPIDLLKIDKSLIDDIENDEKRRDFVRAVITMGQLMECEIISEGVEYEQQIDCLKEDGCDFVQGFVWGKPLMYDDARRLAIG